MQATLRQEHWMIFSKKREFTFVFLVNKQSMYQVSKDYLFYSVIVSLFSIKMESFQIHSNMELCFNSYSLIYYRISLIKVEERPKNLNWVNKLHLNKILISEWTDGNHYTPQKNLCTWLFRFACLDRNRNRKIVILHEKTLWEQCNLIL